MCIVNFLLEILIQNNLLNPPHVELFGFLESNISWEQGKTIQSLVRTNTTTKC